ncbi:MAG: glycosyltransferase [Clostridia bacterium]|jgi:processive 1,2-diacylglycerol beta-glucosyltransferase|nr:glycosyltransferase [Clostridia bacterium]
MPISQRFLEDFDKKEIKKEFGLKDNLKTILFFAGGRMGLARKNIFEYMQTLANIKENIQIVAVSGKNKKVYERFKQIAENKENIKVLEFTNKVPELMRISDLVITKPGGITSSEALASNVPILAINPIPGQEEENAEFLEENKVAIWLKPKDKLQEKLKEVLKDKTLNNLKENTKKLGNANSAKEICENILKTMV